MLNFNILAMLTPTLNYTCLLKFHSNILMPCTLHMVGSTEMILSTIVLVYATQAE